jgi:hypothetical protein
MQIKFPLEMNHILHRGFACSFTAIAFFEVGAFSFLNIF